MIFTGSWPRSVISEVSGCILLAEPFEIQSTVTDPGSGRRPINQDVTLQTNRRSQGELKLRISAIMDAMPSRDTANADRFPDDQYAAIIRDMIRHEDSVLAQRMTWCVQIEGLLMASLAFAWDKAPSALIYIVCTVGAFVAISALYTGIVAMKTMRRLTEDWKQRCGPDYNGPPVIAREIDNWITFLRPSRAIPGLFVFIWVLIALIRFTH